MKDDSIRPYCGVVTNGDIPKKLRASTDIDVVPYLRCTGLLHMAETHSDILTNPTVVAEFGVSTDNDSAKVLDFETFAHFGFARKFNAGKNLNHFVEKLVKEGERLSKEPRMEGVSPLPEAVDDHDPETLA